MIVQRVEILVECTSLKNTYLLQKHTRCWKNVLFAENLSHLGEDNFVSLQPDFPVVL